MADPKDRQDEAVTTPIEAGERTAEFGAIDPTLSALAERYDLLRELGRGGMGIVYQARDRETGDIVALKVLQPEIAAIPALIDRFKSELLLARKITHKNVCRVYDLNRFGSVAAITMEYVEGESLRKLLERVEGLSVRHALKILRQVIAGLAEAHAQGVVHRDLKPENIVLARDGSVKLMDFGIARSIEADATETRSIIGTPAYMSPEQALGQPVDARGDIYSLGLTMFEMFAGQPVFRADTPAEMVYKHVHEPPPEPRSVEPDLPQRIDDAIRKCLEKDPKKRFKSVAELEMALLEQPRAEISPEAEPVPSPQLSVWGVRDWVLLALGVVGLIYFLAVRDTVFPASKMRLEVDAISARRTAEELATRLGRPLPELWQAQLDSRADRYTRTLETWVFGYFRGQTRPPIQSIWPTDLVAWRVQFRGPTDHLMAEAGGVPERFAIVDSKGKVERLWISGIVPTKYEPLPVEERRTIAQRAAEVACGGLPANYQLREFAAGEKGTPFYRATWVPRAVERDPLLGLGGVQVSLLAEKVVGVECRAELAPSVVSPLAVNERLRYMVARGQWVARALLALALIALFIGTHCYRLHTIWQRLPLAVFLGLACAWLFAPSMQESETAKGMLAPSWSILFIGAFAAVGLIWLGLITAEHSLRRRTPEKVASYLLAWKGRLADRAVSLAIVRGALGGLVFVAAQTVFPHVGYALASLVQERKWGAMPLALLPLYVDPAPVGGALESFSPALFVLCAALFDAVVIAVIFLGVPWGRFAPKRPEEWRIYSFGPGMKGWFSVAVFWWMTGLTLHVVPLLFQPFAWYFGLWSAVILLILLLRTYDVLTVMAAVATAVIWLMNYPLLEILREVGNAAHWAIFFAWGTMVLLAVAFAFRATLSDIRKRFAASFQS